MSVIRSVRNYKHKINKTLIVKQWLLSEDGLKWLEDYVNQENEQESIKKTRQPNQKNYLNINYAETYWMQLYKDPKTRLRDSREYKEFRLKFRVPIMVFDLIKAQCIEFNIFEQKDKYRTKIPIEIKLLLCLRVLGRDECMDSIGEFCQVRPNTCLFYFHKFIKNYPLFLKDKIIKLPDKDELSKIMAVYNKLGLPGAIGSVDATHIKWDRSRLSI
jgi:hypothetical protein